MREIEGELREQCEQVHGPGRPAERQPTRERQHQDGAERVRGAREQGQRHRGRPQGARVAEHEAGCDGERHEAERQCEEHRDEHELRRDGRAVADLELDA